MIAVLQRAASAAVTVKGRTVGEIGKGLLVLLGVSREDSEQDAAALAAKIVKCRIFEDEAGRMNRCVTDVGGGVLVVSNFTLLANYRRGNRPDFLEAAPPAVANELYEYFTECLRREVTSVATGEFGADMTIDLKADGPVTIVMDSRVLSTPRHA